MKKLNFNHVYDGLYHKALLIELPENHSFGGGVLEMSKEVNGTHYSPFGEVVGVWEDEEGKILIEESVNNVESIFVGLSGERYPEHDYEY